MTRAPYRIAFVLDTLEVGGIQRQLLEVCRELLRRKWAVTVLCLRSQGAAMEPAYRAAGCLVYLLGKVRRLDWSAVSKLRRLLHETEPDIIHAMTPQSAIWSRLVLPRNSQTIFLGSFLNTFAFERLLPRLVERLWVAPRLDGILVNSRAAVRLYRQNISGRVSIACIHNGVETPVSIQRAVVRQNLGIAEAEIAVVAVGRLVPVKGFGYLIGAWGQLAKNHPTASLHLIGDGPMMGELRRAARDLGSAARVVFHGELSEPREVLPAFDVFVMPSLSEGFPNALLEGMAAGLPCVATRVGGIPEVGQKAGLSLIPPADPTALARAMSTLLADEEERRRRGKLARDAVVDRFPMRRMINKTIRWYQKALAAGDNEQ